jgi:low temperature requirement protein LtrA
MDSLTPEKMHRAEKIGFIVVFSLICMENIIRALAFGAKYSYITPYKTGGTVIQQILAIVIFWFFYYGHSKKSARKGKQQWKEVVIYLIQALIVIGH